MEGERLEVSKEYATASSKAGRLLDAVEAMPKPGTELGCMPSIRQAVKTMSEGGAWHGAELGLSPEDVVLAWQLVELVRLHGLDAEFVL